MQQCLFLIKLLLYSLFVLDYSSSIPYEELFISSESVIDGEKCIIHHCLICNYKVNRKSIIRRHARIHANK